MYIEHVNDKNHGRGNDGGSWNDVWLWNRNDAGYLPKIYNEGEPQIAPEKCSVDDIEAPGIDKPTWPSAVETSHTK
ncbi:hypothetical protein M378DRAFT_174532 [Amanita muscaria Koide BX008]|uniref:Uncharacterized protein n=1 Tax=Amanita muscaria (strain Koide BX008) TaxID=946122 RepID=A0A0C2WBE3_AMAMK|nr:hypothetical protein M378DRAFT_174532 [Amanita muscaria Koide BX008]